MLGPCFDRRAALEVPIGQLASFFIRVLPAVIAEGTTECEAQIL